ncbi:hypothetical protein Tco_1290506, partial [Tanacetum coccineum]
TNEEPANESERKCQEKEGGASNKEDDQNVQDFRAELDNWLVQQKEGYANSTNRDSTVSPSVSTAGKKFTDADDLPTNPLMPDLEDTADLLNTGIFSGAYDDEVVGVEADLNNLETTMNVSRIPTTRIHKDHPKDQIIGDINSATQTRRMTKISKEHAMYVADILKKFDFVTMKTTSTPIETNKALLKDEEAKDVDVHLYRSMIGSLMYLTASRPDIMFSIFSCARFQVTPKVSHIHAMKRIFRYLKGQSKLGLWYPRDSPFDLEAFSDSNYARASLNKKSTIGGCQFLSKRLISWQCKKQTIVSNSTTEVEYVAAENCYGQVLWIQNQMLDYGFNFMNTKIYIDNESTICIVKNPVFHSKTKHIEIRHHFIRDSYEKRLIQVIKIHTDHNVADLLTKAFDVSSIRDKFGNKTGSCKVKHIEYMVGDEAVHKELGDRMERAATTASSLEAEQDSVIHQFWQTASASTSKNGEMEITATIDGRVKTVTEASIRRHLKLEDSDGISTLPNTKIFEQLALMGYVSNSDRLTFQKGHFSPQWRFLIHTILHCLSAKKTAWDQFSSNIATAIICLATNRTFNFSKLIFDGMVKNLDNQSKFLMYPRFIQIFLNKHKRQLLPHKRTYIAPTLTQKLFGNMRRISKGYNGVDIPLFPTMLVQGLIFQGEGSTVPVESHHTPTVAPSTSPPHISPTLRSPIRQETKVPQLSSPPHTNVADEAASTGVDVRHGGAATTVTSLDAGQGSGNINKTPSMPHDSPLPRGHTLGSDEGRMQQHELMDLVTKLLDKFEALEIDLRQTKKIYGDAFTRLIKKERMIEEIDQDAGVTLVTPTHSQEDQPKD